MDDVQSFDIRQYLRCLEYVFNPSNESLEGVKNYNLVMINLYKNKEVATVE